MRIISIAFVATSLLALAACQGEPAAPARDSEQVATPAPAPAMPSDENTGETPSYAAWVGKWTGPEGLFVNITQLDGGRYRLEMQSDLDTKGTYDGTATSEGIAFTRDGEELTLRKATGDETGLKYLAGKTDCLMVKPSEGFCRA